MNYLVFARKLYQQPLELLGVLRADDERAEDGTRLVEQVRAQFGEADWIEMIAIPQPAITQVIPTPND
jgi:hypothetical protein